MANDLNQVRIDGRLVEEPKIKQLDGGARVATIRIANNRYFKGKEERSGRKRPDSLKFRRGTRLQIRFQT